jgi:hypothetical protein
MREEAEHNLETPRFDIQQSGLGEDECNLPRTPVEIARERYCGIRRRI